MATDYDNYIAQEPHEAEEPDEDSLYESARDQEDEK